MSRCVLYWLHDETCNDPRRHGYVGATSFPELRKRQHRENKNFPKGHKWTILFRGSKNKCLKLEAEFRPEDGIGWNKTRGGGFEPKGGGVPPGYRFSDKTKLNMSKAQKGRKKSKAHRRKISEALMGHVRTEESRAKQSASARGKPKSLKWRRMMSRLAKKRGGFFKGGFSEEARAKMREAAKRNWARRKRALEK